MSFKKFYMEQNFQKSIQDAQPAAAVFESSSLIKFGRIDLVASIVLGFIISVFTPIILNSIGKALPFQSFYFVIFPILALAGVWITYKVAAKIPVIVEIAKFGGIGVANTVIDFGVLNLLSSFAHIFSGVKLMPLNVVSFSIAVINSYFWNKYWTFKSEGKATSSGSQFVTFIIVSVIGLLINTGIVYLVTTFASPFGGVSQAVWLNIGKLAATFISLAWNFVGYKFIVFKR